jgi:hypothetical protein
MQFVRAKSAQRTADGRLLSIPTGYRLVTEYASSSSYWAKLCLDLGKLI